MTKGTRYTNGSEVITFKKILPVFAGLGIDHYVFTRENNRDLIMPKGEWLRKVSKEWRVTV